MYMYIVMMTNEGSTKIVTFMTPGTVVLVLVLDRAVSIQILALLTRYQ